jgi:hypothetical protein
MYSQLFEAIYNSRKIYYHISPNKFKKFEKRNGYRKDDQTQGGTFLTPNPKMCQEYAKDYLVDKKPAIRYYLYRCMIPPNLDIFNPSVDYQKFYDEVSKAPVEFIRKFAINSRSYVPVNLKKIVEDILTDNNWFSMENPATAGIIGSLGFDGFQTTENNIVNFIVYDSDKIRIIDDGPYSIIGYSTIDRDFNKLFGLKYSLSKKRTKLSPPEEFEKYKLNNQFVITVVDLNGKKLEDLDFMDCFDKRGQLILDNLENLLNRTYDTPDIQYQYNGNIYNKRELYDALAADYTTKDHEYEEDDEDEG